MRARLWIVAGALMVLNHNAAVAANSDWLCTEQASQREGNAILACGVGSGTDENQARLAAFDNSKAEFTRICSASADCKDHEITVEPKRTTCEQDKGSYRCYRLIVFYIGEIVSRPLETKRSSGNPRAPSPSYQDKPEQFQPFVYSQTKNLPKVSIGMKKADLLAAFGAPYSTREPGIGPGVIYIYLGKMCVGDGGCTVTVDNGVVTSYIDLLPIYTDALK